MDRLLRGDDPVKPTVNVLYLPGTNCQAETMRALRQVGADPRMIFVSDALAGRARLDDADITCLPGGFSFGDHIAAGAVGGLLLRTRLRDQFNACLGRPMICICNGFQIALRAGCFGPNVALKTNSTGTFLNNPAQRHHVVSVNDSPWLAGLQDTILEFPCAHGEGRFVYTAEDSWNVALKYPADENPDGSAGDIAGITTNNGLIFGLMNHPERATDPHVRLAFFANGIRAARH
jgi:phosphoribosylformylglycinamidine synthase subunit PurQ / glutaminase